MNKNSENDFSQQLNSRVEEELVSRRLVLKRALTFGCGALIPIVLIGCDSKQSDSSTNVAPSGTSKAATNRQAEPAAPSTARGSPGAPSGTPEAGAKTATAPATPGKVTQASVQYQDQPMGDQKCSGCALFVEPNACSVVEGEISPEGWCAIWVPIAS